MGLYQASGELLFYFALGSELKKLQSICDETMYFNKCLENFVSKLSIYIPELHVGVSGCVCFCYQHFFVHACRGKGKRELGKQGKAHFVACENVVVEIVGIFVQIFHSPHNFEQQLYSCKMYEHGD